MQWKINNTVICLRMGKNLTAKTPQGDFLVTTPETPLLSQQAVTSKGIPSTLPNYSWTLTPIPNWTCSVVTVPLSNARLPSTWLTIARIPVRDFKTPTEKIIGCNQVIFRSFLPKLHYYHNKLLQVKESQVPYQPTVELLPQYPIGLVL